METRRKEGIKSHRRDPSASSIQINLYGKYSKKCTSSMLTFIRLLYASSRVKQPILAHMENVTVSRHACLGFQKISVLRMWSGPVNNGKGVETPKWNQCVVSRGTYSLNIRCF